MSTPFHPSGTVGPVSRTTAIWSDRAEIRSPGTTILPVSRNSWASGILSTSTSESPVGWPAAARNVKHIPPPMSKVSTRRRRDAIVPIFSPTLAPPSTATNGRQGDSINSDSTSTSRASNRPAADGSRPGGPTTDAWARWAVPNASLTYSSWPSTSRSTKLGSSASSPGSNRRFSSRVTPGSQGAQTSPDGSYIEAGVRLRPWAVPDGCRRSPARRGR